MTKDKLIFINPASEVYGSERSMLALLNTLNLSTEVICPAGGELERRVRSMGIAVHHVLFGRFSLKSNPLWHVFLLIKLVLILTRSNAKYVIINLEGNTPVVVMAAVLCRCKIIRYCRFELKSRLSQVQQFFWSLCDVIICPSIHVGNQIKDSLTKENSTCVRVMYDPVDVFSNGAPIKTPHRRSFCLGYVGRIHHAKRIEVAIEAFHQLIESGLWGELQIIGGHDGSIESVEYHEYLLSMVQKLNIQNNVIFRGALPHDQVINALKSFDVLIMPSESESFGLVLAEAWANFVPTVSSNVSGLSEITNLSRGGLLAEVGNSTSFAAQIMVLYNDLSLAKQLAINGHRWTTEYCSTVSYAREFEKLLNNL